MITNIFKSIVPGQTSDRNFAWVILLNSHHVLSASYSCHYLSMRKWNLEIIQPKIMKLEKAEQGFKPKSVFSRVQALPCWAQRSFLQLFENQVGRRNKLWGQSYKQTLVLPPPSCGTMGRWLHFSKLSFLIYKMGTINDHIIELRVDEWHMKVFKHSAKLVTNPSKMC